MQDSFSATRTNVYEEVLGRELFARLKAKNRGHIYFYAKRYSLREIPLLYEIRDGKITIEEIEADHARWRSARGQ